MEPKNPNPSPEDIFTWKMNNSDEYQTRFMTDFEFAKVELDRTGIQIDEQSYKEFTTAFSTLSKLGGKIFQIPGKKWIPIAIFVEPLPKKF